MGSTSLILAAVTATQATAEATATSGAASDPLVLVPLLMIGGMLLIILETVVPGGVVGTVGVLLLLAAVIVTSRNHGGTAALVVLAVSIVGSLVALAVAWHYLPRTSLGDKLFLTPSTGASTPPGTREGMAKASIKPGDRGTALSDLRPAGLARIGEWRVDVMSRGEFIETGAPVEVVALDGTRIVVRANHGSAPEAQ